MVSVKRDRNCIRLPEVAETTTKTSPTLQKHSLGGCIIEMPPSNCRRRGISFRTVY